MLAYYRSLRDKDGLTHEEAVRDSIVSVLMSPKFCYRIDLVDDAAKSRSAALQASAAPKSAKAAGGASTAPMPVRPLSGYALASRLSYFLWSSMPDEELVARG
jgi:hypothetical protein